MPLTGGVFSCAQFCVQFALVNCTLWNPSQDVSNLNETLLIFLSLYLPFN